MNKKDTIEFFDRLAPTWDADLITDDSVIAKILDAAHIGEGSHILDVACGTGVLIPYYMDRGAANIIGVDISPNMIREANIKFKDYSQVELICGDAEEISFPETFTAVMVYNAFPHFNAPKQLIAHLATLTKPGGTLTVAHGMSLKKVNSHHSGSARSVSRDLIPAEELAGIFAGEFDDISVINDESMYLVSGIKR